ncbi:hypothetical protein CJ030_MR3G001096 [Morella rubra]|uniref:Uncharacterized protein n=1 Tax=Morella rubra TaxID=262757 RepID=A0A6A1W2I9_9ROSI|nr:hypothetical protein CJ030_MR3G001096 [Morella rubra]
MHALYYLLRLRGGNWILWIPVEERSLSPLFAEISPESREKILAKASDVETLLAVGEGAVKKKSRPHRGKDFKFREALIKADFWLL